MTPQTALKRLENLAGQPIELIDHSEVAQLVSLAAQTMAATGHPQWSRYVGDFELGTEAARRLRSGMIGVTRRSTAAPNDKAPLTVAQAAQRFNLGRRTVYRLVETGELPAARVGKAIRVRPADLERYLGLDQASGSLYG